MAPVTAHRETFPEPVSILPRHLAQSTRLLFPGGNPGIQGSDSPALERRVGGASPVLSVLNLSQEESLEIS